MLVWNKSNKKPKKSGLYLVLVRLKDSQRTEFDIATWIAVRWRWDTNYWEGDVIWWTELPDKDNFTDDNIKLMLKQEE